MRKTTKTRSYRTEQQANGLWSVFRVTVTREPKWFFFYEKSVHEKFLGSPDSFSKSEKLIKKDIAEVTPNLIMTTNFYDDKGDTLLPDW